MYNSRHTYTSTRNAIPLLLLVNICVSLSACPAFIYLDKDSTLIGLDLRQLSLQKWSASKGWSPLPLQLDKISEAGRVSFPGDANYRPNTLEPNDRLIVEPSMFTEGRSWNKRKKPCEGSLLLSLINRKGDISYLFKCTDQLSNKNSRKSIVKMDDSLRMISSTNYQYYINPKNALLFNSINIFDRHKNKYHQVASNSYLAIFANFKYFFYFGHDFKFIP